MTSSKKQMMDIGKMKSFPVAISDEHQRNWSKDLFDRKASDTSYNYDPTRTELNFQVGKGGTIAAVDKSRTITEKVDRIIKERVTGRVNEASVRAVSIIFGGNREQMRSLAFGRQSVDEHGNNQKLECQMPIRNWARDVYLFCCQEFGEDNIASFIVHLDELNPHAHCVVVPVTNDGRLSAKEMFGGRNINEARERMKQLHNRLAKVNEKYGLERGDDVQVTGAKHKPLETYRRELATDCKAIEREIDAKQEQLASLKVRIGFAERRIKGLRTMVSNLEQAESEKQQVVTSLETQIRMGHDDMDIIRQRLEAERASLYDIQARLRDKRDKLRLAQSQQEAIAQEVERLRETQETMNKKMKLEVKEHFTKIDHLAASTSLSLILEEMSDILPQLQSRDRELFDTTFVSRLMNQASETVHVALLLFVNMVDDATAFAETHGGGGDNSQDWGRKDTDDDRQWMKRCLLRATQMMQPKRKWGWRR